MYNSTVILLLGLGSLITFGLWAWYITKREKKDFGEIMSILAANKSESIFVGIVILIFFSEAVLAASVHPPGEMPPPPLARFLSHLSISIVGTVASVAFVKEIASIFEKGLDAASIVVRIFIVAGIAILALGVPLGNAMLIAAGLGEDMKFYLFCMDYLTLGVDDTDFYLIVAKYGGNSSYQSWGAMSYVMKTTIFLTMSHILISIIEGLRNVSSKQRRSLLFAPAKSEEGDDKDKKKKKEEKTPEQKRKERKERDEDYEMTKGEERTVDELEENLEFLLGRMKYEKGEKMDNMVDTASKALYSIKRAEDRVRFCGKIATIVADCKTTDKDKSLSEEEKKNKKHKQRTKIRALFEGAPDAPKLEDRGLGCTLQGRGGKN